MAKLPKVSVVVPIYNVERYLRECVDSILAQALKDIEVILVDDGSPDGSPAIIDEYAKKDKRIVPIHRKNGGYSKAVNYGISIARGEYIGIVESDDWIDADMYEKLYKKAKKFDADIAKCEFYTYNSTVIGRARNRKFIAGGGSIDLDKAPDDAFTIVDWPELLGLHASIWSCIYKSEFVKKIKVIDTEAASYQDFPFMVETMCKARSIVVVKEPMLHWRNDPNQGNSTSQKGPKLLYMAENSVNAYQKLIKSGMYDKLKEPFVAQLVWANYNCFFAIKKQYKAEYYNRLVDLFKFLDDDPHFEYKYFDRDPFYDDSWFLAQIKLDNWQKARRNLLKRKMQRGYRYIKRRLFSNVRERGQIEANQQKILSMLDGEQKSK